MVSCDRVRVRINVYEYGFRAGLADRFARGRRCALGKSLRRPSSVPKGKQCQTKASVPELTLASCGCLTKLRKLFLKRADLGPHQ